MATTNSQPYRRFGEKRIMPIVQLSNGDGFYVFPSEQSHAEWDGFEVNKPDLTQDGQGIPLFHFKRKSCFMGSRRKPKYLIYKYIVQKCEQAPPCDESQPIADDNVHCLYKVLLCEVTTSYEEYSVVYKLKFPFFYKYVEDYDFVNSIKQIGYCGSMEGFDLSWKLCDDKLDEYELWSDLENMSRLVNGAFTSINGERGQMKDAPLSATALYSRRECNPLERDANLIVLEQTPAMNLGITAVPALTEVLACHGMLIHLTRRRVREGEAQRNIAAASNSAGQLAATVVMLDLTS